MEESQRVDPRSLTWFKPGNPGRPTGSENKLSKYVRHVLAGAFAEIGGEEAFVEWARENKTDYYTKLWIKLLPDSSQLSDDEREKVMNAMLGVPQVLTQLYEGEIVKDATSGESKRETVDTGDNSGGSPRGGVQSVEGGVSDATGDVATRLQGGAPPNAK